MIEVMKQNELQGAPAGSCEELFRRLIPLRGKTLLVEIPSGRKIEGKFVSKTKELGQLRWLRSEESTGYIYIDLGGTARYENRRVGHINLDSSIWVELDGELRPIHIPKGREREI